MSAPHSLETRIDRSMLRTLLLLLSLLAIAPAVDAQRRGGGRDSAAIEATDDPGIAWFGSWEGALAEAKRTGKPILLFSAAPQCRAVPGMW